MNDTDMRCQDCKDIGCECPRGYVTARLACIACGTMYVIAAAGCVDITAVPCKECGSLATKLSEVHVE